ncbi:MAG: lipooligosaccharide sialyltransferase, partial [Lachnospiraceae bacterium]|nr:lipooligosaccharide sialyltransferase [Lachnospiraceae bacterium]
SRQELADALTKEDRALLVRLFIANIEEIQEKLSVGKDKILLLTEPLCALPVRERIFRDCIDLYGRKEGAESVILIKPHPRDLLDYEKIFSGHIVLDRKFPMEVLNYIEGLTFSRVISVFTVVRNIRFAEEIIYLGEDFMDKYEDPRLHRQNEEI